MRKSIATVSLSGTLEEKLAAAAQVGFGGVELFENDLISCPLTPAQIRRRARDLGLRIELYQPLRDIEAVPEPIFARNLRRAEAKFAVMNELGVDTILLCSNTSTAARNDDTLAAEQLWQISEVAARYGVRVAYEALAWGRHVNTYSHAWKIVDMAGHPGLGICLDSFHILSRGDDPAAIEDIPADRIFFVQFADAPRMSLDVLQWSRHYRCFPGQGSFDLTAFLGHVIVAGYSGPLSLEVFNDVFRQADAERTATDALRSLIALEGSVRAHLTKQPTGDQTARAWELAAPEPPVALTGYSFVEITVDPLAELASQHVLRGLGFRLTGRHRSKPVRMWQQGTARVLLNRTRPHRDDWPRGDAGVSAFAVEGDDPSRSARRAQTMLAPAIPRRYGPGEADLFATETPDGTSVFFCTTDLADPASWLADFEPAPPDSATAGAGIVSIDHIGLSQPAYYFEEAALFYQSVLGLGRRHSEEVADPYGLVRSRAMSSADGSVRLVLNVPALGGGKRPETADFQHVAFSCLDVFGAAARMRSLRLPVLSIPGNYYHDLAARTTLSGARIEAMRDLSICYDSDGDGGEYFHFFAPMLGRRLFFEIVQRVNGYDGYASANTPVRMAAQYRQTVLAGITG
jgi:4-hydroxyphenylpyruvate dioxygenase